jgi:hypothetical protein
MADQPSDISHFTISDLAPYLEGLFMTETAEDWVQTHKFLKSYPYSQENDPLLGKDPSTAKMTAFGAALDAGQYEIYNNLSDKYKLPYAAISAGLEGANVYHNAQSRTKPGSNKLGYPSEAEALAVGAAITAALVNKFNKESKSKNNLSVDIEQIPNTKATGPMLRMEW